MNTRALKLAPWPAHYSLLLRLRHAFQPLDHPPQLVAGDEFDVNAVFPDETPRLVGKGAGGHHEHARRTLRRSHAADFAHHLHAHPLHPPVFALHQITVLADTRHQINAAVSLAPAALLDAETLAPEKLPHQVLELAPGQQLQRDMPVLARDIGIILYCL